MHAGGQLDGHDRVPTATVARVANLRAVDFQAEAVVTVDDEGDGSRNPDEDLARAVDGKVVAGAEPAFAPLLGICDSWPKNSQARPKMARFSAS